MNFHHFLAKILTVSTVTTVILISSCKHGNRKNSSLSYFEDTYQDTFFVNDTFINSPERCRAQILNIASNSLADGLLLNGALTGLGTQNPTGKKLKTDGFYKQIIRIYSIFDWEVYQRLIFTEGNLCVPEKVHMSYASYPRSEAPQYPRPYKDLVDKVIKGIRYLSKDSWTFDVLEMNAYEAPTLWPRIPGGSSKHLAMIKKGILAKTKQISLAEENSTNIKTKLTSMSLAFSPLNLIFDGYFPTHKREKSQTFVEGYLPPLYELKSPDKSKVETWYLDRGIKRRELPLPYDIGIARLTHIAYLSENPKTDEIPLIKFQVFKDFSQPERIKTKLIFGKTSPDGPEKGAISLDFRDPSTAFVVSLYPNLAEYSDDSATIRFLKKEVNSLINTFRIDARIHRLSLDLVRKTQNSNPALDPDSILLEPRFSLRDSDISFRLIIDSEKGAQAQALEILGFNCKKDSVNHTCYLEFGGFTEAQAFFTEESKGILGSLKASISIRFAQILNLLTKYNAKILINWRIESIEEAIDKQFIQILQDITESQKKAREEVQERLDQFFAEE